MLARTLAGLCVVLVVSFVLGEVKSTASQSNTATSALTVLTVRRNGTDATDRFLRSAKVYGYTVKFLGDGGKEEGSKEGGKTHSTLELLKDELATLAEDKPVLFTESVDVILAAGPVRVIEEWETCGCEVFVSADGFCWPDSSLESHYPRVDRGKRFLNAGGFVGRAGKLLKLLSETPKKIDDEPKKKTTKEEEQGVGQGGNEEDSELQTHLTLAYLHNPTRNKYKMKIDHLATLFQNLNGATGDVEMRWAGKEGYLQNTLYSTVPVVVRGNGHSNLVLSRLGSYLARSWNPEDGCRSCWDDMVSLEDKEEKDYPRVTMGVYVERPVPFLEEFITKLQELAYPKNKIDLYIHSNAKYHDEALSSWVDAIGPQYASTKFIKSTENVKGWHARNVALAYCVEKNCDFYMSVDAEAHLDNPFTLKLLIEQNRRVVAPMLTRPYKAWSNFWGAITQDGFYSRSVDYMDIVQNKNRGLWNVPYVSACYLLKRSLLDDPNTKPSYIRNLLDPDMALCENLREKKIFMYVTNRVDFGHLVNGMSFNPERLNPELWELLENRWDWEHRYLHPNFSIAVAENTTVEMPCPDVYWFPLFKERYAKEMIQTFEDFGVWSDGTHEPRYKDGPPQASIAQVGLGEVWQEVLARWVALVARKIFTGYDRYPPRAVMNFMVRYKPDEQPLLRPHHDTSTYTINVALNRPGNDYQGGGCRFIRYNCSVTDSRVGWVLMHPGRLTHLHEGLKVTEGTRYIIVSFVDP